MIDTFEANSRRQANRSCCNKSLWVNELYLNKICHYTVNQRQELTKLKKKESNDLQSCGIKSARGLFSRRVQFASFIWNKSRSLHLL